MKQTSTKPQEKADKKSPIIKYRGKCTEDYVGVLHRIEAPSTIIMTLKKLKIVLPSLETPAEKILRNGVVSKLNFQRCSAYYVGQTSQHLQSRFKEDINNQGPMKSHLSQYHTAMAAEYVDILQ